MQRVFGDEVILQAERHALIECRHVLLVKGIRLAKETRVHVNTYVVQDAAAWKTLRRTFVIMISLEFVHFDATGRHGGTSPSCRPALGGGPRNATPEHACQDAVFPDQHGRTLLHPPTTQAPQ